jgi:hypothetical protein
MAGITTVAAQVSWSRRVFKFLGRLWAVSANRLAPRAPDCASHTDVRGCRWVGVRPQPIQPLSEVGRSSHRLAAARRRRGGTPVWVVLPNVDSLDQRGRSEPITDTAAPLDFLIRGFGVRVPGGAHHLTWPFTDNGGRPASFVVPAWLPVPLAASSPECPRHALGGVVGQLGHHVLVRAEGQADL